MALEDLLREAAAKGLTHFSLHPVPSEDGKKTYWRATATPSTMHKYVSTAALDPVESVTQVLTALPKASKRKASEAPLLNGEQQKITAAVNATLDPPNDEWSRFK